MKFRTIALSLALAVAVSVVSHAADVRVATDRTDGSTIVDTMYVFNAGGDKLIRHSPVKGNVTVDNVVTMSIGLDETRVATGGGVCYRLAFSIGNPKMGMKLKWEHTGTGVSGEMPVTDETVILCKGTLVNHDALAGDGK